MRLDQALGSFNQAGETVEFVVKGHFIEPSSIDRGSGLVSQDHLSRIAQHCKVLSSSPRKMSDILQRRMLDESAVVRSPEDVRVLFGAMPSMQSFGYEGGYRCTSDSQIAFNVRPALDGALALASLL